MYSKWSNINNVKGAQQIRCTPLVEQGFIPGLFLGLLGGSCLTQRLLPTQGRTLLPKKELGDGLLPRIDTEGQGILQRPTKSRDGFLTILIASSFFRHKYLSRSHCRSRPSWKSEKGHSHIQPRQLSRSQQEGHSGLPADIQEFEPKELSPCCPPRQLV